MYILVDHHIVIPNALLNFPFCPRHANFNLLLRGVLPVTQAALQLLQGRGHDENQHRIRHRLPYPLGTHGVNIQKDGAFCPLLLQLGAGRAVVGFVVVVVFQERIFVNHPAELLHGDEVIAHALHLVGTGGPGSGRNGEGQVGSLLHGQFQCRALAHTGGTGNHNQFSFIHCTFSSASSVIFPCQRSPSAWVVSADRITWSVSISTTARVLRP